MTLAIFSLVMTMAKIIVLSVCFAVIALTIIFAIVYTRKSNKVIRESQIDVSDKELIEFINNQPDKIIDYKALMNEFGLTKFEAGGRLRHFLTHGLLRIMSSRNGMQRYYTLAKPIEKPYDLKLTDDPFMTVEDLLLIFKHCDYQVTIQEICLITGLPIKVIVEEMKYFEKEKVVKCLLLSQNNGFSYQKIYSLCEPYRSNPDKFLNLEELNFELEEIYKNAKKA